MNRYIFIRRLRVPAILMLIGVLALLHEMGVLRFWHLFIPLLLILLGVLLLAERAILAVDGYPPFPTQYPDPYANQYPGAPYSAAGDPLAAAAPAQPPSQPGSSIVPAAPHDITFDRDRGQS
jgi:hypothetical protein